MHKTLLALLLLGATVIQAQDRYRVELDIANTETDRVRVSMWPPKPSTDSVVVVFPVTVPGTYETHNWWKLVNNFLALDADLKPLRVTRSADSQFVVHNATRLNFLSYEMDDSFDDSTHGISVFPPSGTGFEHDSIFVLNHGGVVCFIEGMQQMPFQVSVRRPKHLWGGSAMNIARISDTLDTYLADTYDHLVDNPVLYSWPDTATYVVSGVRVLVHCAHAGTDTVAPAYAKELARLTKTIGKFLPTMPVNRYAFLFYLWNMDPKKVHNPRGMGALEHGNSSFYFLGFQKRPMGLREVAVHEFLHILVPLNLHSEEIERFDFRSPKMSQHLWLYEGTTEYFATLAPLHDSTIKEERFMKEMEGKLRSGQLPQNFSWTAFSRDVLSELGQKLYPVVYTHGAFNAMLLDIVIRESTNNQMSLLRVIYRLMQDYGKSRPFHDDSLFSLIESVTNSTVRAYLDEHVKGTTPPNIAKILDYIGWSYIAERVTRGPGFGVKGAMQIVNGDPQLMLQADDPENPLGVQDNDRLVRINGLTLEEVFQSSEGRAQFSKLREAKIGDQLTITVERNGKEIELTGAATTVRKVERNFIEANAAASQEQLRLRRALFYN